MLRAMNNATPTTLANHPLQVVCVCASWCGVCRDFAATFATLTEAHPGVRFHWLDLEDDAELLDELEVDNFPTFLMSVGGQVVFQGPVLPQLPGLHRLIREAIHLPALGLAGALAQQVLTQLTA
jgi:thiol-disulfide isomerase/thioredoxin